MSMYRKQVLMTDGAMEERVVAATRLEARRVGLRRWRGVSGVQLRRDSAGVRQSHGAQSRPDSVTKLQNAKRN